MKYFVTGIGTDVGKTVVSAILAEALNADYWKPVQCGYPRDVETVETLVTNSRSKFHPECFLLNEPASPHQAAALEGINLKVSHIQAPTTTNHLVIEGAGGVMVPINDQEFMLDLIKKFADEVVLVASLYLGSINHSLLTIDLLRYHGIGIKGLIFNGQPNEYSESIILSHGKCRKLLHLEANSNIDVNKIKQWAKSLENNWE